MTDQKTSRLNVPPPPSTTTSRLAESAPASSAVQDNLSKATDGLQDLNFKVNPGFHRQFKMTASAWGMSMKDLLEASFKKWLEEHGERPEGGVDIMIR